jgi:hypothetical protein
MAHSESNSNTRVPVVTDLVIPGDPKLKKLAEASSKKDNEAVHKLQKHIEEVESAIGQDDGQTIGRAHAIRKEKAEME